MCSTMDITIPTHRDVPEETFNERPSRKFSPVESNTQANPDPGLIDVTPLGQMTVRR